MVGKLYRGPAMLVRENALLILRRQGGEAPRAHDYAKVLERVKGRPDAQLLQTAMLRSLRQAVISVAIRTVMSLRASCKTPTSRLSMAVRGMATTPSKGPVWQALTLRPLLRS